MNILSDVELAYIAGIIDGEGSISLTHSNARSSSAYVYPLVRVANTSKPLVDWLNDKVGVGSMQYKSKLHMKCKDVYHWGVAGKDAMDLLEKVMPYLVIKKRQAEVALALKAENDAALNKAGRKNFGHGHPVPMWLRHFREACFHYIIDLNRRGVGGYQNGDIVMYHISEMEREELALCL